MSILQSRLVRSLPCSVAALPAAIGIAMVVLGLDYQLIVRDMMGEAGPFAHGVFFVMGVVALMAFVPKTALSILAGMYFGTAFGFLLMLGIAAFAATINYGVGRWWLYPLVQHRILASSGGRLFSRMVRDNDTGWHFHFLVRMTPVPAAVVSYGMGAFHSRYVPYLIGAVMGVLPQVLWIQAGAFAADSTSASDSPLAWIGLVLSIAAALGVGLLITRFAKCNLESLQSSLAESQSHE